MNKLQMYYPQGYAKDVFSIDYRKLYSMGFRGLVFDIDNTLVHHGDDSTPEVDQLFRDLYDMGFHTLLLTNNDEERVQRFIKNIDTLYLCDANKPEPDGYERAVQMLSLPKNQVIVVGDQVFTDILGANRSGLKSILVHFIREKNERWIGKKRYIEMLILWCWRHSRAYAHRLEGK